MKDRSNNPSPYTFVYKTEEGKAKILDKYRTILKNWPAPYDEINLSTKYGNTFILRCGEKGLAPLILLHGTSSNSSMWIDDVTEYSKHYCVYAIDIPGEPGLSEERQYPLVNSVYPDWLNEVVTGLGINMPSIVGISLGAWLAVGFASKYPDKVRKLALLCPSGIGNQRTSFLFKAMFYMLSGEKGYDKLTNLVNGGLPIPKEAIEYTKLISKEFNLRPGLVPIYTDEELKKLTMPLLVYTGEKDVLLNSKSTINRVSKLLPHAKAKLLPGYGHVLIGLKKEITEFLLEE